MRKEEREGKKGKGRHTMNSGRMVREETWSKRVVEMMMYFAILPVRVCRFERVSTEAEEQRRRAKKSAP